jgi:2OG-Fe(II) oxygenase superfamily
MTYPGDSKIIRRSKLSPELRDTFLQARYFSSKPILEMPMNGMAPDLSYFTNYLIPAHPNSFIDEAVLAFLDNEKFDYTNKKIEYWFQHQVPGQELLPHCDHNHHAREVIYQDVGGKWLHTVDKDKVMSPITIACYLQADSLEGGELCISSRSWLDEATPTILYTDITNAYLYETYIPVVDDVLYFEGSRYYHWIRPVMAGERKSMMINFWPLDL